MKEDEIRRLKNRIGKAERRLAKGVDKRQEARGVVSESEIRDRLMKRLNELQESGR
jgi:hypothetical protein